MARVSKSDIAGWVGGLSTPIPSGFFVAMAGRESGYDPANVTHEDNGEDSIGLFQVNAGEASSVGYDGADLTDPQVNTAVIVALMNRNLNSLALKYGFSYDSPPSDIWYYLAASHNAGLGKVESWIDEQNGAIDWSLTVENHPKFVTIAKGYAQEIGDAAKSNFIPALSNTTIIVILLIAGAILVEYSARSI